MIYYLLLTRGDKGCCIFCRDEALRDYLAEKVELARRKYLWVKYFVNLYAAQQEEKKVQQLYDAILLKKKHISGEEYENLKELLENSRKEAEKYRNYYLNTKFVMEQLGITPDMLENIHSVLEEVKTNADKIQDEDERAHYVQEESAKVLSNIMQPVLKNNGVERVKNKIKQFIGEAAWNKMNEKSKRFLISAEVMYENLASYNTLIDFSGVCLQVTKAFECEMTERFFTRYREYLKTTYKNDYYDIMPKTFYRGKKRKIEIRPDQFTLGNIVHTVGMFPDGKMIDQDEHRLFLQYAENRLLKRKDDIEDILRKHLSAIEKVRIKYRNKAAHKGTFDVIEAKECLDYIIEIERVLGRLLEEYNF